MSQSGSQAAAFFRDVRENRVVWPVRDGDGSPTHLSADGPGRPPGSKNRHPATRYDVGKTVKRPETIIERDRARP